MEFRLTPSCDSGGCSQCASQAPKPPAITPAASKSQHAAEGTPEHSCGSVLGPTQHHVGFLSHHRDQNAVGDGKFLFTYYMKIKTGQAHLKQLQMVIKSCFWAKCLDKMPVFIYLWQQEEGSGSKFKGPFSEFVGNWTSKYKIPLQSFELAFPR